MGAGGPEDFAAGAAAFATAGTRVGLDGLLAGGGVVVVDFDVSVTRMEPRCRIGMPGKGAS